MENKCKPKGRMENPYYIGKDGRDYPSVEALRQANEIDRRRNYKPIRYGLPESKLVPEKIIRTF